MKHLFIVNPTAGGKDKTEEVRARVSAAFASREDSFEIYVTKAPMDAARKIEARFSAGEYSKIKTASDSNAQRDDRRVGCEAARPTEPFERR